MSGPDAGPGAAPLGSGLVRASWAGTVGLAAVTVVAVASPDDLSILSVAVSLPMFVLGSLAMLLAFARAVERSRREAIGMGGLYLLAGSAAPAPVRRSMMLSLGAQVAIGLVGAGIRPYTPVAFGVLASMWGLGLAGLWGSTHGTFASRAPGSEGAVADGSSAGSAEN